MLKSRIHRATVTGCDADYVAPDPDRRRGLVSHPLAIPARSTRRRPPGPGSRFRAAWS